MSLEREWTVVSRRRPDAFLERARAACCYKYNLPFLLTRDDQLANSSSPLTNPARYEAQTRAETHSVSTDKRCAQQARATRVSFSRYGLSIHMCTTHCLDINLKPFRYWNWSNWHSNFVRHDSCHMIYGCWINTVDAATKLTWVLPANILTKIVLAL